MSNASFQVYIDESGCEGFRYDRGSPEWFVLSAVITCTSNDLETVKLIDAVRETIGIKQGHALHFRKLKHERRIPYVNAIANSKIRAISILVHKPSLEEKEKFQSKNILYFYATRFLIERISWFCREMHSTNQPGDGSPDLVFSKRKNMSYEELKEYLNRLEMQSQYKDIQIDWNYIKRIR